MSIPAKYAAPPCDICRMIGALASLAASREATTVDEDVTFYRELVYRCWMGGYNSGDSELMFASIFKKLHDEQTENKIGPIREVHGEHRRHRLRRVSIRVLQLHP